MPMDTVTKKLDTSMGETAVGEGCESESPASATAASVVTKSAAEPVMPPASTCGGESQSTHCPREPLCLKAA